MQKQAGRLVQTPGHLIDLMATAVDVSGVTYPANVKPMEGQSLKSLIIGSNEVPKALTSRALFWEHEGNRAVREGDWKLVMEHGKPWELYDMAHDRSEQHDLSKEQPERVQKMSAQWEAYAARANVEPWNKVMPKPSGKGAKKAKVND
jgi:arylsulfatase